MKKMKKVIVCILSSLLVICINPMVSKADIGSFESYDSGFSDSWDSGSGDSWSSDWDSSWGDSWSDDWDSDDSWTQSTSGGRKIYMLSISNQNKVTYIISFILVLSIISFLLKFFIIPKIKRKIRYENTRDERKKVRNSARVLDEMIIDPEIYQGPVVEKIKSIDPLFDKDKFNENVEKLFINMQNAWTQRDWQKIREFETDELYEQHKMQIDGYVNSGTINVLENICVYYSKISNYEQKGDKEILNAVVKVTMADYIIDEKTKKVLKGNKKQIKEKFYDLEFIRRKGVKTNIENEGIERKDCPNCGASIKIKATGECEYCGTMITNGDYGWLLNNYEPFNFNN